MQFLTVIKRNRLLGVGLLAVQSIPKIYTLPRGPRINGIPSCQVQDTYWLCRYNIVDDRDILLDNPCCIIKVYYRKREVSNVMAVMLVLLIEGVHGVCR
jgi:hypothetical protein